MINRKHKDRLFVKIFGAEENKENLMELYNALNDTNYTNIDDFEINTIDDVIYMGMKNDISCIIDDEMPLYEQQSTFNPNMPIRGFMYYGKLYNKYIKTGEYNIYGEKLIKLPQPAYYVFYNGDRNFPDRKVLKLSDAFKKSDKDGSFEWTAIMLNINYGHNKKLLDQCKILKEYAILIKIIKENLKKYSDKEEAIDKAVMHCIENDILSKYLQENRAEVIDVCLTEYNEEEVMGMFKRDSYENGIRDGETSMVVSMVKDGSITLEYGAKKLGIAVEELKKMTD